MYFETESAYVRTPRVGRNTDEGTDEIRNRGNREIRGRPAEETHGGGGGDGGCKSRTCRNSSELSRLRSRGRNVINKAHEVVWCRTFLFGAEPPRGRKMSLAFLRTFRRRGCVYQRVRSSFRANKGETFRSVAIPRGKSRSEAPTSRRNVVQVSVCTVDSDYIPNTVRKQLKTSNVRGHNKT